MSKTICYRGANRHKDRIGRGMSIYVLNSDVARKVYYSVMPKEEEPAEGCLSCWRELFWYKVSMRMFLLMLGVGRE